MNILNKLMAGESVIYADLLQDQHAAQLALRNSILAQVKASVIEMIALYDAEVARLTVENERLQETINQLVTDICELTDTDTAEAPYEEVTG